MYLLELHKFILQLHSVLKEGGMIEGGRSSGERVVERGGVMEGRE